MGSMYKKSNSERYKRYFTHEKDLINEYRMYSLNDKMCIDNNGDYVEKPWETGYGGVPISINRSSITNFKAVFIDHTDAHTLVIGPTGSKKSRLVAMPLTRILGSNKAKESMIISDPKSEIYKRTASFLEDQGYKIHVINFRSPEYGDCWNPLYIPYRFYIEGSVDRAYEFVNDISENLIRNHRQDKGDPFWDNSAGSLFFGLVLLLFKYCKEHNLDMEYIHIGNVVRLRNRLFINNATDQFLWDYAKRDPIIESSLIGTVETAKDTKAGILSVFDQKMRMFSIQPNLLRMLSANTADIDNLLEMPTVFYLILPDEKTGYHGLAALFIKQSYEYLIYNAQQIDEGYFEDGRLKRRINYVLDEFSSLPAISDFPEMITAARSRNIRFTLIIQSKNQLIQRYKEEAETIQTNCNNWVFLTSKELSMLKDISELCGDVSLDSKSVPLLSVSELQRLNKDEGEALVFIGRKKPLITFLPDITEYDNNKNTVRVLPRQSLKQVKLIDQIITDEESDFVKNRINSSSIRESLDFEAMMRRIDEKIKELDEEEKRLSAQDELNTNGSSRTNDEE